MGHTFSRERQTEWTRVTEIKLNKTSEMSDGDHDFETVRMLGKGAFGEVFLVKDKTDDDVEYAMKVIDISSAPQDERDLARREAALLSEFKHAHILKYFNSFESNGALCILTEYCCNGDVAGYLEKRNGRPLPESLMIQWFQEVCCALQYLHERNVLHRDLKTQNIFLMSNYSTKLGDLGLARVLDHPNAKAVTFCGSPYYMSPEIFSCKPYDSKSDIWALGVCIYEMATLEKPFEAMLMHQLVFKIVHGELPEMPHKQYSQELISLMEKMLTKDADNRPTADEILSNPLFKNTVVSKTPPPQYSNPRQKAGAQRSVMSRYIRKFMADREEATAFNMDSLMSTLSLVNKRKKPEVANKSGNGAEYNTNYGVQTIMKGTFIDKTKADKTVITGKTTKTITGYKSRKFLHNDSETLPDISESSTSSRDFYSGEVAAAATADVSTFGAQSLGTSNHVMNLVVRTLTGLFNKDTDDRKSSMKDTLVDPETMLLRQIDELQFHCVKVLGMEKFQKAYDMLSYVSDTEELEENLIKILGKEAFAQCGVQLFYCKNFEYNLQKM